MSFRQITVAGLPAIAIRGAELELVVVPSLGQRLTHLRRPRGREWLWHNPELEPAQPASPAGDDVSYAAVADSGGWDECFPTVAPSPVPGTDIQLPDHGELWSAAWQGDVFDHPGGTTLTGVAAGQRLPYEFRREITVDPHEPVALFRYTLRHTGESEFPWIWSAHPLLTVQAGSRLEIPAMAQVRVDAAYGRTDLTRGDIVAWPGGVGGSADRFTLPEPAAGWALKLFGDIGGDGRMVVTDPRRGERLEFAVVPAEVPLVGLWINCGGWAPDGRQPYFNLGLEPCLGAPDRLADAADWGGAPVLRPGEIRTWGLQVRLPDWD